MLSAAEYEVLDAFREYLIKPGEMLCFHGPKLLQYERPLDSLVEKEMVRKETNVEGAYTLTQTGFVASRADAVAQRLSKN